MRNSSREIQANQEDLTDKELGLPFSDRIVLRMMEGVRGAAIDSSNAWDAPVNDNELMAHYGRMRKEGKLDEPEELPKPF